MPRIEVPRKELVRRSSKVDLTPEEALMGTRRARLIETNANQIAEDSKDFCVKIFKGEMSKEEAERVLHDRVTAMLNSVK